MQMINGRNVHNHAELKTRMESGNLAKAYNQSVIYERELDTPKTVKYGLMLAYVDSFTHDIASVYVGVGLFV